jgi:hypothetical protein
MSKAFTPPPTMSQDDILVVADVRRSIWTGGFKGLAAGLLGGFSVHYCARTFLPISMFPPKYAAGKYTFLWVLGGGAVLSFVGASTAGKNNVHTMHDVFERGAKPVQTEYQAQV